MNARRFGYWAATGVLAFAVGMGALMDLAHAPPVMLSLRNLGYPTYLATVLGAWKALAVPALLAPRFPRLKEWAYAGLVFDLSGAAISHALSGDHLGSLVPPLFLLALTAVSWSLRPEARKLAPAAPNAAVVELQGPASERRLAA